MQPKIDSTINRSLKNFILFFCITFHADCVEKFRIVHRESVGHNCASKMFGKNVHALCNLFQAFRPVIARIKRRHVCQQCLRCADITRGFLTADVLLARAERKAQRGFATRIFGHADNAAGHLAFEFVARAEERGMRAAVAKRHAEALCAADRDVRAKLARRLDKRERE